MVTTFNGAVTNASTGSGLVDLFAVIGASRGKDLIRELKTALYLNEDVAIRTLLWARDVRGGAGERQTFRNLFVWLCENKPEIATKILPKIPEIGRWDDVLVAMDTPIKKDVVSLLQKALIEKNGLCAKWLPRKGNIAVQLTRAFGLSPKQYRKMLVSLTAVVEQQMCAKNWRGINYEHVPSVATARYRQAFKRHDEQRFNSFIAKALKGEVKINASAIFPHDVLKNIRDEKQHPAMQAQWQNLPNYLPENVNILPMIDVSVSMGCMGAAGVINVAIALGIYTAQRTSGDLKNKFLTFSESPCLVSFDGDAYIAKIANSVSRTHWGMNTNLFLAAKRVVELETQPDYIMIFSDMEFDQSCKGDVKTNFEQIENLYKTHNKKMPKFVFWNLRARVGNNPVRIDDTGVCLVSGFSPAIMKAVLACETEKITPEKIMLDAVMVERYNWNI